MWRSCQTAPTARRAAHRCVLASANSSHILVPAINSGSRAVRGRGAAPRRRSAPQRSRSRHKHTGDLDTHAHPHVQHPLTGHFLPLLPLARALRTQGHDVAFVSAAAMADPVGAEGFEFIPASPGVDVAIAEVTRRTGANLMTDPSPALVAEFFAGARVDLGVDEALTGARAWEPDLVVSEHCDFVGPLVAAVLKVPSAVMGIDPALEPDILDALASTAHSRYLDRGLQAPAHAPSGRWLLDACPPGLQRDGALPPLERIALRPEPHRGPEGTSRAARVPGTGRPRVLVSLSTTPGTRRPRSVRCCVR
ncbi:hypothetical protein ACFYWP_17960 [Actinacidiphila glaucinigra]|uniref:hypothetical protein n=1 Tax=Actinacidiphila glaucinigra TaxID=235986 RepID=UPI00369CBB4C